MKRALLLAALLLLPVLALAQAPVVVVGGAMAPNASGLTSTTVTCGTVSTAFGSLNTQYLAIQVPPGGVQVWFAPGATAATTAPPSKGYPGGTDVQLAGGVMNCIVATGSQNIAVWTK